MISVDSYFEKVKEYKFLAKHEVGQNFLIDPDVCEKIVSFAELKPSDRVLEIGPGAGSLSYFIAQSGSDSDLIDIDEGLITKLKDDFSEKENVHPLVGNALRWDFSTYDKVVGNLPYYITTSLIERILLDGKHLTKASLMVQKEAFARITSKIGTPDYGPLPILLSYRAFVKKEMFVPRTSFLPMPHIDSVVFSMSFKDDEGTVSPKDLYKVMTALFLHRRKTILNNLTSYLGDSLKAKDVLKKACIDIKERPENLSLAQYLSLAKALL